MLPPMSTSTGNIVKPDIAGKNRQKPSKVDDVDRIVRSQEPEAKWSIVIVNPGIARIHARLENSDRPNTALGIRSAA